MATGKHAEGLVVIRAGYSDLTATAYYNGEATPLATGSGVSRAAAIADCVTNLNAKIVGSNTAGSAGNILNRVPYIVLPTVQTYQIL